MPGEIIQPNMPAPGVPYREGLDPILPDGSVTHEKIATPAVSRDQLDFAVVTPADLDAVVAQLESEIQGAALGPDVYKLLVAGVYTG